MSIFTIIEKKKNDYIAKNGRLPNTVIMSYRDYNDLFEDIRSRIRPVSSLETIASLSRIIGLDIIKSYDVVDIKIGYIEEEKI